jgi:hypothetical protein
MSDESSFWSGLLGIAAILACLWAFTGCSPEDRQKIRSAAQELKVQDAPQFACVTAHAFDGQWDELEVMRRFCQGEELKWWAAEADRIREHVVEQRGGK